MHVCIALDDAVADTARASVRHSLFLGRLLGLLGLVRRQVDRDMRTCHPLAPDVMHTSRTPNRLSRTTEG